MIPGESLIERKQQEKINYLRQVENDRKKRIFDSKQRTIGVDIQALNKQVVEQQSLKQQEEKREKNYADLVQKQDLLLVVTERQTLQERKDRDVADNEFRKTQQSYQSSHLSKEEQDEKLGSPFQRAYCADTAKQSAIDSFSKDRYGTCSDNTLLGCSGLQHFAGEDSDCQERMEKQLLQKRLWYEQFVFENDQKQKKEQEERRVEEEQLAERFRLDQLQESMHQEQIRSKSKQICSENKALAEQQRLKNAKDNTLPFDNNASAVKSTDFKGFNPEQERAIFEEQTRQRQTRQMLFEKELELEKQFALQQEKLQLYEAIQQQKQKRQASQIQKQLGKEQLLLADAQTKQKAAQNEDLKRNAISNDYFMQFNTTTR